MEIFIPLMAIVVIVFVVPTLRHSARLRRRQSDDGAAGVWFGLPVPLVARIPRLIILIITTVAIRAVRITADLMKAGSIAVEGTAGVVEDIID